MELIDVIIKPYHTEKSYILRKFQENSCLAFVVNPRANKMLVRSAFKSIYNVDPVKINILNRKSQSFRNGTAVPGRTKHLKIAYIILPKGMQVAITKDEMEEATKGTGSDVKETTSSKKEIKKSGIDDLNKTPSSVKQDAKVKPKKEVKTESLDNKVAAPKNIRKQARGK